MRRILFILFVYHALGYSSMLMSEAEILFYLFSPVWLISYFTCFEGGTNFCLLVATVISFILMAFIITLCRKVYFLLNK